MRARAVSLIALALSGLARPAVAEEVRAVVDQVSVEPSILGGQELRILYSSVIAMTGQVLDLPESSAVRIYAGASKLDVPIAVGTYGATKSYTAIVFVVQSTLEFAEVLPVISEAIDQNVFAGLNEHTQIAVLTYGNTLGLGKLAKVKTARAQVSTLVSDLSTGEPVLLDSVERALGMLKKAKTDPEDQPIRKLLVVIGDGHDRSNDRDRVQRLGARAAKEDVRIHTLGFAPHDVRRPLLLLGELSKQSLGTFRWVRGPTASSWVPALQQLHSEIVKQVVITAYLPAEEDVHGKKLHLVITKPTEITSTEHKIGDTLCLGIACEAGQYCGSERCIQPRAAKRRGVLGWVFIIAGIVVGVVVLLGLIGFAMTKRQEAVAKRPAPVVPPPGSVPPAPIASIPAASVPTTIQSQPPASRARFYVLSGPRTGEEVAIKHGFFIGKIPTCDFVIDDGYASGHHAQIVMDQGGNCRIYDFGSTNGTFVNGVRITDVALDHGATVKIGSTELRFLAD
ncbi:MAG: FHA domain-containing protein [Kofleriaceae bacterium]